MQRKLKSFKRTLEYSQEYIAYQLGISQKTYSVIEQGKIKISTELIFRLAKILKVPSSSLIEVTCDCDSIIKDKYSALIKYLTDQNVKVPSEFLILITTLLV